MFGINPPPSVSRLSLFGSNTPNQQQAIITSTLPSTSSATNTLSHQVISENKDESEMAEEDKDVENEEEKKGSNGPIPKLYKNQLQEIFSFFTAN